MKILSAKQYGVKLKATVQNSGRLGFSTGAAAVLQLNAGTMIRFAQENEESDVLYLAVMEGEDEDAFRVVESGGYYSVNTRPLFDALEVDFKTCTLIYDLTRDKNRDAETGGVTYRMEPRRLPRKAKGGDDAVSD